MDRIPNWAATLAVSCLILLLGAWGGRLSICTSANQTEISAVKEQTAAINARLSAVEEQLKELRQEVRLLTKSIEHINFKEVRSCNE